MSSVETCKCVMYLSLAPVPNTFTVQSSSLRMKKKATDLFASITGFFPIVNKDLLNCFNRLHSEKMF